MSAIDQKPQFLGYALIQDDLHAARDGSEGDSALFATKSNTACTTFTTLLENKIVRLVEK
jgi:hypothetical protein